MRLFISFLLLMFCFASTAKDAQAQDCTNPGGDLGVIFYNEDFGVYQGCTPRGWIGLNSMVCPDGDGADPCGSCYSSLAPGTVCTNGSIYAGLSPDGNVPMFTTPADAGAFSWNDGSSNWVDLAMQNCVSNSPGAEASCQTGEANTALLVALGTTPSPAPYVAARHCDNLDAHGQSDWYLPAQDELNVLWVNRVAIGGFDLTGSYPAGWYWSSSEGNNTSARIQRLSAGTQASDNKNSGLSVRCVRR